MDTQFQALIKRVEALEKRAAPVAKPPVTMEEFQQLQAKVSEMRDHQDDMNDLLHGLDGMVSDLQKWIGADQVDGPFYPEFQALKIVVGELQERLGDPGRNKSTALKRPMTDADALKCLTGEFKDLKHKEAGEKMGLTYAQVYSCRCEYTFKEVHAALRKQGWTNPWARD